jgi:hypothetical protein
MNAEAAGQVLGKPHTLPEASERALRDTSWSNVVSVPEDRPERAADVTASPAQRSVIAEGGRSWWGGRSKAYGPRFDALGVLRSGGSPATTSAGE